MVRSLILILLFVLLLLHQSIIIYQFDITTNSFYVRLIVKTVKCLGNLLIRLAAGSTQRGNLSFAPKTDNRDFKQVIKKKRF